MLLQVVLVLKDPPAGVTPKKTSNVTKVKMEKNSSYLNVSAFRTMFVARGGISTPCILRLW